LQSLQILSANSVTVVSAFVPILKSSFRDKKHSVNHVVNICVASSLIS
jgi:hypothetical protein